MIEEQRERVFAALGDTMRRLLIEKLATGETKTATELASELPITRQGVAKHMKILVEAGLVRSNRVGRETIYILTPQSLTLVAEWVATITEQWDERLQKLYAYVVDQDDTHEQ